MIKSKKQMFMVIGVFLLVMMLTTVTYAFFNYTRVGTANNIRTGRIYFNTSQNGTLNLSNMFPIEANSTNLSDPTKVGIVTIDVIGDTTYDNGVEYLVSSVNVTNTINNKSVPISIDVSYGEASGETIGTEDVDYYNNRGGNTSIYKILAKDTVKNNDQLIIGYIAKGATGIDGTITIKAYLDKDKILISDTYPSGDVTHTESSQEVLDYTNGTEESMAEGKTVFTTQEWNSLQANGISFQIKVEANDGIWVDTTAYAQIIKNVDTDTLIDFALVSSSTNGQGLYILPGTEDDANPIYYYRGNINNNNVIFGDFCWQMIRTTDTGGIKMIYNGVVTGNGKTCENTFASSRQFSSNIAFSSGKTSASYVGYMKNNSYDYISETPTSGAYFGTSVEYGDFDDNGTNEYRLVDDGNGSISTTIDAYHHYSCDSTNPAGTCSPIRYYFSHSDYSSYYIKLYSGETVEDALYRMTGTGDDAIKSRNANYKLNYGNSTIKYGLDSWFRTNLTNEVDNTKINYANYLEDTVFCNDRSLKTVEGSSYYTYENSGWNPNGGSLRNSTLYFGTLNKVYNNWYSTTNVPTLECPNETDRFSVSSSIAHLDYPIGLLMAEEIIMAGASGNQSTNNKAYYLYTGNDYWTMTPYSFPGSIPRMVTVYYNGSISDYNVANTSLVGTRPVVSLKSGIEFIRGGDGTPTNPYVVKY